MRVAVFGASGFIGGAIVRRLLGDGHEVVAFGRDADALARLPDLPGLSRAAGDPAAWAERLAGAEAMVIAVGAMAGADMEAANAPLLARLVPAARRASIGRAVLISAIGASAEAPTRFLRAKAEGEAVFLDARPPGWTVLRPSLVYGPGGTSMALLAALAALPLRPALPDGPVRPIAVDDLAAAVVRLIERGGPLPPTLDAVGPERMTLDAYADGIGAWLGSRSRRLPAPPRAFLDAAARLAGPLRLPLLSRDALAMARMGADGDPAPLADFTGVAPAPLALGLAHRPATSADRLAARLGPWPTLLRLSLVIVWLGSGLASLANVEAGLALLGPAGVPPPLAMLSIVGGGVLDLVLGAALFARRHVAVVCLAQAATILAYTLIGTLLVPALWLDPLGPLLKNAPILAATLLLAALHRR